MIEIKREMMVELEEACGRIARIAEVLQIGISGAERRATSEVAHPSAPMASISREVAGEERAREDYGGSQLSAPAAKKDKPFRLDGADL
jgi:hypothetical protein